MIPKTVVACNIADIDIKEKTIISEILEDLTKPQKNPLNELKLIKNSVVSKSKYLL